MNDEIFSRFLYESESDSLDFKRDQYKFIHANDDDKSELLKDIIAMANSWRRIDGYFIIGIIDKPDKPNELFGITEHIDDSKLQQFVNSKTNKICNFEYKTYTYDGITFGIIRIPVQKRPLYLKKNYGKLKKDIVYVRHGSSTDEAKIDEISQMGKSVVEEIRLPALDINFYDKEDGIVVGKTIDKKAMHLEVIEDIPDYKVRMGSMYVSWGMENEDYYREFYQYMDFYTSYKPFYFQIENNGNIEAKNIKIEITLYETDLDINLDGDEKKEPVKDRFQNLTLRQNIASQSEYFIDRKRNRVIIYSTLQMLHAKRSLELGGIVYINPLRNRTISLEAKMYCDNVEIPFIYQMKIIFDYESIELKWHKYKEYLNDRGISI